MSESLADAYPKEQERIPRAPAGAQERTNWNERLVWHKGRFWYLCHATDGDDCVGPFRTPEEAYRALKALQGHVAPQPQPDRAALVEKACALALQTLTLCEGVMMTKRDGSATDTARNEARRLALAILSLSAPTEATGDGIADDTEAIQRGALIRPGKLAEATERPAQGEARDTLADLHHLAVWRTNSSSTIRWPDGDLFMGPFASEDAATHALDTLRALTRQQEADARGETEPDAWLVERQKDGEWRWVGASNHEDEAERFAQDERRAGSPARVVPLYRRPERAEPVGARFTERDVELLRWILRENPEIATWDAWGQWGDHAVNSLADRILSALGAAAQQGEGPPMVRQCEDCDEPGKCRAYGCGWAAVVKLRGWTLDELSARPLRTS